MEFKKQTNYSGKIKGLTIVNGKFVDSDGEIIDLATILSSVYGDMSFDLSTTAKTDVAIEPEINENTDEDTDEE